MLSDKDVKVITSILGDDIIEELEKSEIGGGLFKPTTKTALDPQEMKIALEIVPRTILSWLMANLKDKNQDENCRCEIPFAPGAVLECVKHGPDNYSGEIIKEGKRCATFKNRSLPGVGLIVLTTFELYSLSEQKQVEVEREDKLDKLQQIIDEKLALHKLVRDVVDQRISERQAIDHMIKQRLSQAVMLTVEPEQVKDEEPPAMEKKNKLKQFLENREKKRSESVEMEKGEINCPDCGTALYKKEQKDHIKLCMCYGEKMNKTIKFTKSENGKVNFQFPKSFDMDNIEMLLDAIKKN